MREGKGKRGISGDSGIFGREQSFEQFLCRIFAELREAGADRLTIDLRGNFGWVSGMARELLSYLTEREIPLLHQGIQSFRRYGLSEMSGNILPKENCFKGDITRFLQMAAAFQPAAILRQCLRENHLGRIPGAPLAERAACTDFRQMQCTGEYRAQAPLFPRAFAVQADESMRNGVEPDGV